MPHEDSHQRLIEAATRAFVDDGYGAVSLDRIARGAGISKKTIYKFFASKAELFVAVVENAMRPIPTGDLRASIDDEDPRIALRRFLTAAATLALSQDGLAFYRMIVREAASFPELLPAFYGVLADFWNAILTWMEHQQQRGWLAIETPEHGATTIFTLLLGETRSRYLLEMQPAPDEAELARIVDHAMRVFLDGSLAKRPSSSSYLASE